MTKYGLKLDEYNPKDYVFGASPLPYEVLQPDGDWSPYLPVKEFQNLNNVEPYACVTFAVLNCVETLIKRKYGEDRNYSDRFLAMVSGTKEGGNSPQVVCEFLRKIGVVPQELWPFDETINTFEKFYSPIPPKLYELAREFNREWDFKHENVPLTDNSITSALTTSPLMMSVAAWFLRNGKYYKPQGMTDNHATTLFYQREGDFRRVFDSYDKPHLKDVEWDSMPMVVKRFWIEKKSITIEQKQSLWEVVKSFLFGHPEEVAKLEPVLNPIMQKTKLIEAVKAMIGKDASPNNKAPKELSCAEGVSNILHSVIPEFPEGVVSTINLVKELRRCTLFKPTLTPEAGVVVVSPRTDEVNGHAGIFIKDDRIASNDSRTGLMQDNYSWNSWIETFKENKGLRIFLFRLG